MKSAVVEREAGAAEAERRMLEGGLAKFPLAWKMWLMLGQLEQRLGREDAARDAFTRGLRRCPACVPLWKAAASLEARPAARWGAPESPLPIPARAASAARRLRRGGQANASCAAGSSCGGWSSAGGSEQPHPTPFRAGDGGPHRQGEGHPRAGEAQGAAVRRAVARGDPHGAEGEPREGAKRGPRRGCAQAGGSCRCLVPHSFPASGRAHGNRRGEKPRLTFPTPFSPALLPLLRRRRRRCWRRACRTARSPGGCGRRR